MWQIMFTSYLHQALEAAQSYAANPTSYRKRKIVELFKAALSVAELAWEEVYKRKVINKAVAMLTEACGAAKVPACVSEAGR